MTDKDHYTIEQLLNLPVYQLTHTEKQSFLYDTLLSLTEHHHQHCPKYQRFIDAWLGDKKLLEQLLSTEDIPAFSVRHFKDETLYSIPKAQIFKTLLSSGTNGSLSKITLDAKTAKLQSSILVKTLQHWLGKARRPMLIIDAKSTLKKTQMNARAAGISGFSLFGRNHCYALNDDLTLNTSAIKIFFQQFQQQPILIFGFTFIIWQQFVQAMQKIDLTFNCTDAVLIHGGGWKKMLDNSVSTNEFKQSISTLLGNVSVHDYYGMVEQTGTIHIACEHGYLHTPVWADVVVRRPADLTAANHNELGLIQVNSTIANSYPGHCLLTEDLGMIIGEDDCQCGRKGKYFIVQGRVPRAENRGCSDTFS